MRIRILRRLTISFTRGGCYSPMQRGKIFPLSIKLLNIIDEESLTWLTEPLKALQTSGSYFGTRYIVAKLIVFEATFVPLSAVKINSVLSRCTFPKI